MFTIKEIAMNLIWTQEEFDSMKKGESSHFGFFDN